MSAVAARRGAAARAFAKLAPVGALGVFAAFALAGAAPSPLLLPSTSGEPWTDAQIAGLTTDLDALLAKPALRGAHVGVLVVDSRSGSVLYSHAADDEFQPASTLKLLVGSAALERLGPTFRFRTAAYVRGSLTQRALRGRLILRGGGDPTLTRRDLDRLAPVVASLTKQLVDVEVDESRYDRRPYPAGWVWDDFAQDYAPKITALTIDGNVLEYTVAAASAIGASPRVSRDDRYLGIPAEGTADPRLLDPLAVRAKTAGPSATSSIDVERLPGDPSSLIGSEPLGGSETVAVAAVDPALRARLEFVAALHAAGVDVPGFAIAGPDSEAHRDKVRDDTTLLWSHDSEPLASLLGPAFWIPSNNLFAELLLKELGFATAGAPGTTDNGTRYERTWLQSIGVDLRATTLADGSGLSQYDRIAPRALVAILQHDWNGPSRQLVLDSLPVGAARGTIEGVAGTAAAGRVFAKTGSMSHVRGLAGYLATQRHGAVTFAFNVDDFNGDPASLAALRAQALARIVSD